MCPIYDFKCDKCGNVTETLVQCPGTTPSCCGVAMTRQYTIGYMVDKYAPALWVHRMDDIHKAQADRGERFRMIHPKEVGAT